MTPATTRNKGRAMSQTKTRLILTRKPGETIRANGPVEFTILALENGRARIMTEADPATRPAEGCLNYARQRVKFRCRLNGKTVP